MMCLFTHITQTLITLIVVGGLAVPGSALATPTTYHLTFDSLFPPIEGFFTYDPTLMQSFSNFHVIWDGLDFDLTSTANAPFINSECDALAPPQLTFALLSHTPSTCTRNSTWQAGFQGDQRFFGFVGDFDGNLNAYSIGIVASIGEPCFFGSCQVGLTIGTFDITPQATAVPDPSPLLTVLTGLAGLGWIRRYWRGA